MCWGIWWGTWWGGVALQDEMAELRDLCSWPLVYVNEGVGVEDGIVAETGWSRLFLSLESCASCGARGEYTPAVKAKMSSVTIVHTVLMLTMMNISPFEYT